MKFSNITINIPNPYGELSLNTLCQFEKVLGNKLPDKYRTLLLASNGGAWLPNIFEISKDESFTSIHNVFGLHTGPQFLRLDDNWLQYQNRIPAQVLAIASDPGGNLICIGIAEHNNGYIYFWDHEINENSILNEMCLVALSLDEFFNKFIFDSYKDEVDKVIKTNDTVTLQSMLDEGTIDLNDKDDNGRTMIERAAIQAKPDIINFLYSYGVELGNALALAKQNAEFFDEHKPVVVMLENLINKQG